MSDAQNPSSAFLGAAQPVGAGDLLPSDGQGGIILVDCNGTMFDAKDRKGLNLDLLDFLIASERRGYKVYLHSNAPEGNMSGYVSLFMVMHVRFKVFMEDRDMKREPIIYKGDIPSSRAVLTIDDEHGGGFASQAPRQWSPNDDRMKATMDVWAKDGRFPAPDSGGPTAPAL